MTKYTVKRNFSLTKKAAIMAAMLGVAVCVVAVSGIRAANQLYVSIQGIISFEKGLSDSIQRIHNKFILLRLHEKDFLLNIGDSKSQQYYMTEFSLLLADLLEDITLFSTVIENNEQLKNDPRALIAYEDLEKSIQLYKNTTLPIFDMIRAAAVHIGSQISVINRETDNQAQSVTQTISSMDTIVTDIDTISQLASNQFAEVSSSTAAVEQMFASINTVTQDVIHSTENVEQLARCADSGRDTLDTVSDLIRDVAHESEGLLEICTVIESIADQTNLLSMNAAIEAAHAGSFGRGFAVVADEIRKLSDSTAEQSKTISSVLISIKKSIDDILKGAGDISYNFVEMNEKIRKVHDRETHFRAAMEEQIVGSRHIMQSTTSLNDISGKVKNGADSMRTESTQVIAQTERLGTLSVGIKDRVHNMTAGIQQITESVHEINGLGIQNTESLRQLSEKLASFKT